MAYVEVGGPAPGSMVKVAENGGHPMGPGNVEQHLTVSGWILIKELHNSLLARFNNKLLSGPGRLILLAYIQLISQDYMKLNKPLLAQKELLFSFDPLLR
ncbi:hypothetical protein PtA15_11A287 [Puccinia triticina]|uniref:Uncharacterized protein n=1 Tax=Puccinia triticina TaxID=208348 RepID=A0ABY7D042_9BASI|nr:uncharacterized protein PtA15_11A287 [Puccinia triticina]WAQ89597.1 hypothetical protein PtA15_11A287 [Puccinia triticina]